MSAGKRNFSLKSCLLEFVSAFHVRFANLVVLYSVSDGGLWFSSPGAQLTWFVFMYMGKLVFQVCEETSCSM